MIDKEKKNKIADILLDFYDEYYSNEINRPMIPSIYAGKILDSLQEEPIALKVLEDMLNAKTAAESLGISQEEHDKIVDKLIYGKEPELVDIDDLPKEEPVSGELEEAIDTYLATYWGGEKEKQEWPFLKKMAIYFAEWQKQKDSIPVSEELEEAMQRNAPDNIGIDDLLYWRNGFITGTKWQKTKDESTTEGLGEYINELSKQFPEVSFAKLSRIAVRVAKWQKQKEYTCYEEAFEDGAKWKVENLWKPADGDDLPEIDREVVVFTQNFPNDVGMMSVAIAHRPNPNGWNGKSLSTGKVEHYTPKTYGKGGWNIPDVVYWLDAKLPKEIELWK